MFDAPEDYEKFLSLLAVQKARLPFFLYAYCLMTNHVHPASFKRAHHCSVSTTLPFRQRRREGRKAQSEINRLVPPNATLLTFPASVKIAGKVCGRSGGDGSPALLKHCPFRVFN
jgi:hypothetical protein